MDRKKDKMNKIQHTYAHTPRHRLDRKQLLQSLLAQPLLCSHMARLKPLVNSKIRIQTKSRNIPTEQRSQKLMIMLWGSGEACERPPTTQEMVISLFLNSSQANPECCLLVLREASGTMTLQKSSNRL